MSFSLFSCTVCHLFLLCCPVTVYCRSLYTRLKITSNIYKFKEHFLQIPSSFRCSCIEREIIVSSGREITEKKNVNSE